MEKALFDQLVESVKQIKAIMRGEIRPSRRFTAAEILGTDAAAIRAQPTVER